MYVDNAMVAVLGLMGLVSLLNWGFFLISLNLRQRNSNSLKTTGMAYSMTGVEDVTFTSSVSEQNNDDISMTTKVEKAEEDPVTQGYFLKKTISKFSTEKKNQRRVWFPTDADMEPHKNNPDNDFGGALYFFVCSS